MGKAMGLKKEVLPPRQALDPRAFSSVRPVRQRRGEVASFVVIAVICGVIGDVLVRLVNAWMVTP